MSILQLLHDSLPAEGSEADQAGAQEQHGGGLGNRRDSHDHVVVVEVAVSAQPVFHADDEAGAFLEDREVLVIGALGLESALRAGDVEPVGLGRE